MRPCEPMWRNDWLALLSLQAGLLFPARPYPGKAVGMDRGKTGNGQEPGARSRSLAACRSTSRTMRPCISHVAIYQALFVQGRGALRRELTACLRTGRVLRTPRARTRGRGKIFISPEIMISKRPAEATDRAVPGHGEGDLIVGFGSSAIGTLVERTTRFTLLLHLPPMIGYGHEARVKNGPALAGHGAEAVRDAITRSIITLPEALRRSLTWDQGAEMAQHASLKIDAGVQVYFCGNCPGTPRWCPGTPSERRSVGEFALEKLAFRSLARPQAAFCGTTWAVTFCDPHSPWQRGTNENTNGLLRQYFPKGTDLSARSADEIAAVAATLNARPRKTLAWKTPAEALDQLLQSDNKDRVATTT